MRISELAGIEFCRKCGVAFNLDYVKSSFEKINYSVEKTTIYTCPVCKQKHYYEDSTGDWEKVIE